MHRKILAIVIASLAGCATQQPGQATFDLINAEMSKAATAAPAQPDAVSAALLPPLQIEVPKPKQPLEERFSLAFNNVPAQQFFMSLVSGTSYNMLVHPEVSGTISANLKDVTLFEALDAIRDLYGYDYAVEGRRIVVKPLSMQTKVFHVNYLTGNRRGSSDTRVSSGSVGDVQPSSTAPNNAFGNNLNNNSNGGTVVRAAESAKVSTALVSDFWGELRSSLEAIVGSNAEGRSVVISPQAGVVVVRAMPDELRNVAAYLKATQLSVDRQVILEAKIIEVQLNDGFQTGVNWSAFRNHGNSRGSVGIISPGAGISTLGANGAPTALSSAGATAIGAVPGTSLASPASAAGSLFGLAFQTSNFAALISFLESQGTVHVLSSPRIATLNNQKAVLKVGTDEFFVTNVSATTTTGTSTTTTPSVTLQPFFSGVVLDVTPQIDDSGNIILHVHPSVSQVSTVNKLIDLGSLGGSLNLPLASSDTSETDSVVRGRDGQIVAIGGLMRQASVSDRSQVPGAGNLPGVGHLFKNTSQSVQKRELVILLKPTIVQGEGNWSQDILESQQRIQRLNPQAPPLQ
ncbi:MAG TPA: pilus (MSHA type) biogenesis protein MshL [Noviherbaspirillum sp.]|uniref:pilus (MSHA type) biogenesis protein MshL n=1 Tax=Noviherbaspirillum sp. TaxID=1926288 RepID=UPI002F931A72